MYPHLLWPLLGQCHQGLFTEDEGAWLNISLCKHRPASPIALAAVAYLKHRLLLCRHCDHCALLAAGAVKAAEQKM